jgi:hypothetical protein
MKPIIMDVNVATGEITNREMTETEYALYISEQEISE